MNDQEFEALRERAVVLYAKQPSKSRQKVSVDAIFTALATAEGRAPLPVEGYNDTHNEPLPQWFTDTLESVKGTGEEMTVSRFLMLAGKFPAQRVDALAVGRWLRRLGYKPTKRGGQLLFKL